jgi:hypothetical protein
MANWPHNQQLGLVLVVEQVVAASHASAVVESYFHNVADSDIGYSAPIKK